MFRPLQGHHQEGCIQRITNTSQCRFKKRYYQYDCVSIHASRCGSHCIYSLMVSLDPSSSSIGATARCGLWPVEQYPSVLSYLSPTLSIFSLPALEDLFLLLLSILSWAFPFVWSLPVLEWRSSGASYPPPFSLGDPTQPILCPFIHFTILHTQFTLSKRFTAENLRG